MTSPDKRRLSLDELQYLQSHPDQISARLDEIFETLTDPEEEIRAWAADCLQEIDQLDVEQSAKVAGLCQHDNHTIVNWACRTLAKSVNVNNCQDTLADVLVRHPNVEVKQTATEALCEISEASDSTRQALVQAASSQDPRLQRLAKRALDRFDC